MIAEVFDKEVHPQLCRRILWDNNFHGRVPRRKLYISKGNQKKGLHFARTYINKDNAFWEKVIFSDEFKFNVFSSDGRNYICKRPNTELQTKRLNQTVKHGGGTQCGAV